MVNPVQGPINYFVPQQPTDIVGQFTRGYTAGSAIGTDIIAAQQQADQMRAAQQRSQLLQEASKGLLTQPQTPESYENTFSQFPELKERFSAQYNRLSEEEKKDTSTRQIQVFSLLSAGDKAGASAMLEERAKALENSNKAQEAAAIRNLAGMVGANPDAAKAAMATSLAAQLGPDWSKNFPQLQYGDAMRAEDAAKSAADINKTNAEILKIQGETDAKKAEVAMKQAEASAAARAAAAGPKFDPNKAPPGMNQKLWEKSIAKVGIVNNIARDVQELSKLYEEYGTEILPTEAKRRQEQLLRRLAVNRLKSQNPDAEPNDGAIQSELDSLQGSIVADGAQNANAIRNWGKGVVSEFYDNWTAAGGSLENAPPVVGVTPATRNGDTQLSLPQDKPVVLKDTAGNTVAPPTPYSVYDKTTGSVVPLASEAQRSAIISAEPNRYQPIASGGAAAAQPTARPSARVPLGRVVNVQSGTSVPYYSEQEKNDYLSRPRNWKLEVTSPQQAANPTPAGRSQPQGFTLPGAGAAVPTPAPVPAPMPNPPLGPPPVRSNVTVAPATPATVVVVPAPAKPAPAIKAVPVETKAEPKAAAEPKKASKQKVVVYDSRDDKFVVRDEGAADVMTSKEPSRYSRYESPAIPNKPVLRLRKVGDATGTIIPMPREEALKRLKRQPPEYILIKE